MLYLRCLALVLMIGGCKAQPGKVMTNIDSNTLLWEVTGNGLSKPSYVFGTFHLLCPSDIKLSEELRTALKNSQELYLELDMDDPATLLGGMLLMNMKDGKKLKDLYTTAEYERVNRYFTDSLKTPFAMMQSMKPYFLVAMLYPKMMRCNTVSGVEEELMKMVKEDKKEIKGLETMAFQASLFDSIPYADQARELLKTVDSMDLYRKYFDTSIAVYKSQQFQKIEGLFNRTEFGLEDHMDILLYDRNRNWVKQLKEIFPKKNVFVAVGAGHLVGEQGLIELLKKAGYSLRPVKNQ